MDIAMSSDMSSASVTQWIAGLKTRDAEAARRLWERYRRILVEHARRRLNGTSLAGGDEEDVALSVFHCLCQGAARGRFARLSNRDELRWLLLRITRQKTIDLRRRDNAARRGRGRTVSGEGIFEQVISDDPTPEEVAILEEEFRRLMSLLRDGEREDRLQDIAALRIEGYTVKEIAKMIGVSHRTVERKLGNIRRRWEKELAR